MDTTDLLGSMKSQVTARLEAAVQNTGVGAF